MVPRMARSKNVTRGKSLGEALRGGLTNYFANMRKEGKTTSDIWAELFEEDAATAMRLAISLTPKEMEIEQTISSTINVNTNHLQDEVFGELMRQAQVEQSTKEVH